MGQGQSQQADPGEEQPATAVDAASSSRVDSSIPPQSQPATAPGDAQHTAVEAAAEDDDKRTPDDPTQAATADDPVAITPPVQETFKVPGLPARPPPPQADTAAVPADIAHIMALGADQPEALGDEKRVQAEGTAAVGRGGREIADVVKELKAKAAMAVDDEKNAAPAAVGAVGEEEDVAAAKRRDELVKVEQEMAMMGVKREPMSDGIEPEEGEIGVDDGQVKAEEEGAGDAKMNADDSSSDSDSDSSSSESDSTMEVAPTGGRQRNRRGRGQRAVSPSDDMADDDDDEMGIASSKTAPKTEHEIAEPEIAPPSVQKLDEAVELAKFGKVESVIENVVVIRADTSGDWRVLDEGTVVCWEDRTVIGNIFETFGSVQQPFYSIRFPANAPPDPSVFNLGRPAFYAPNLASFVFTRDLRAMKGSDASNIWDEEVAAHEMEFSDDEEEAEYRRRLKADRRSRTQSATPGPSGAGRNARQSATPAPSRPSPVPSSLIPARPSVSYADALEPSSFVTSELPSAAPMSSTSAAASSSRAAFGDKPPPGRVGRRMFERDSGAALAPDEEVEFEFSSGEGSDSGEEGEEPQGTSAGGGFARGGASAARGGGRGGASQRGGQRERGRERGRGRGEAPRGGRGGRAVAPLPSRAGGAPASGSPLGLPARPAFETDFGPDAGVDGPVRMSSTGVAATPVGTDTLPAQPFAFGATGTTAASTSLPQTDFRFQVAAASPKQAGSPQARSPVVAAPSRAPGSASAPYQHHQQQQPWSASDAAGRPAAAYGYRPDAYAGMQQQQQPYYAQGASYGGYNPAAPYMAPEAGNAGGYSPHAPSWNAAGGGYRASAAPPVADPRGGHINPRFLPAHGQAPGGHPSPQQQQPPPQQQGQGAASWYANPAAYPPPGGGQGSWW
ncbi:hypothetical protein JCM10908_005555 [Rhodotorula pacifica]|uniref:uncharacterized protein n=1 Tax=Rhodotorula pacifica TaxID=1495444 RepID=UPI0031803731